MAARVSNIYTTTRKGNRRLTVGEVAAAAQAQAKNKSTGNTWGRYSRHYRDAMTITCASWERQNRKIYLFVNPQDVRWSIPRRGTVTKTAAGAVQNVWRNRYRGGGRGSYFDEFTLNITFQTGNVMPFMAYPDQEFTTRDQVDQAVANPGIPPGLDNFYEFLELLDVPMLWGSGENRHIITHHSRVFPDITFEGYFQIDQPITFPESSTDGNRLIWEATFMVYKTTPRISSFSALAGRYRSYLSKAGMSEAIPQGVAMKDSDPLYEGISPLSRNLPGSGVNPRGVGPFNEGISPAGSTKKGKQITASSGSDGFALLRAAGATSGIKK